MSSGGWTTSCTGSAGRSRSNAGGVATGSRSIRAGGCRIFVVSSHRQLAYQRRKWQRPHDVAALADDIDSAKVRGVIREAIVAELRWWGVVPDAMPPPEPSPRRPPPSLKLVKGEDESPKRE